MPKFTEKVKIKNFIYIFSLIYFPVVIFAIKIFCNKNLNLESEELKFVFFPSIASIIPIIFGLSSRNVSISDRARTKATELLKCIEDPKRSTIERYEERKKCLANQITLFDARFMINQWALVSTWLSLIVGLITSVFILNSNQKIYPIIIIELLYFVIALIIYGIILNLYDIYLGSKTLESELKDVRKIIDNISR